MLLELYLHSLCKCDGQECLVGYVEELAKLRVGKEEINKIERKSGRTRKKS